jgi:hypothetical protein
MSTLTMTPKTLTIDDAYLRNLKTSPNMSSDLEKDLVRMEKDSIVKLIHPRENGHSGLYVDVLSKVSAYLVLRGYHVMGDERDIRHIRQLVFGNLEGNPSEGYYFQRK